MRVFIVYIILPLNIFCQTKYLSSYPNFGINIENDTFLYLQYDEGFRIYADCNSYKECKNLYPEQTLMSILSADNYAWDKKNYNYNINENPLKYNKVKNSNKTDFYFKLLLKVTFKVNNSEYAIIKFHIKENDKMVPSCKVLVKKEMTWSAIEPSGTLTKAYLMFNYLSVNALNAIFNNKPLGLTSFDTQLTYIHSGGFLDFNKAINSTSNSKMSEKDLQIILDPLINN